MTRKTLALLFLMGATAARAGVLTWTSNGPETGDVSVVQFDPGNPDIVWAGTRGMGVFRSADGGLTWSPASQGIIGRSVSALAVDPSSSATVYAGTPLGTIYKTTDHGATWVSSGNGLFAGGAPITALMIDPVTPSTLYVATESQAVFPSLGVQKSTNGGQSWFNSGSNGLGTKNVYCLGLDPQNPGTLYAGGLFDNFDRPIFKTTNGGTSWVSISNGVSALGVDAIGVDPLARDTLFFSQTGSLRKSTNGGTSWSSGGSGLPFSTIGTAIVYERNSSSNIWYATFNDVYRTTNGGTSWTAAKIANKRVNGLDVNSAGLVIAGTADSGLYRRPAEATAWTPANTGFLASRILSLIADPSSPGVVYAGTESTGIFKSIDHGRSWQLLSTSLLRSNVNALAIDPKRPAIMFAGTSGLSRSLDGGTTWQSVGFFSRTNAIAIDPVVTDVIYAGTSTGVSKSTNGGGSFSVASTGLPSLTSVDALAIDPTSTMTVYAGVAGEGIYKSTDGGASWTKKSSGMTDPDVEAIVVDPAQPATLYVATNGGGVFKSTSASESWSEANSGLPSKLTLSLALSKDDGALYTGTNGSGVFRSTDGGGTWTQLGGASPAPSLVALAAEPGGIVIHAGAAGGVWSYQFRAFQPAIAITSPANGASIVNRASIAARIVDFTLDCATGGAAGEGRGHWRIDVDGALDSTGCSPAMQLAKSYSHGAHRITVSLRNPDDSPLSPPAESTIDVTIVPPGLHRRAVRR
jgi:photosystem II stability/assembly factor-like uncharacterized protein